MTTHDDVALDERAVWVYLAALIATTAFYLIIVVPQALSTPVEHVEWVTPMIWSLGLSIGATIVGSILVAVRSAVSLAGKGRKPELELSSDARDKDIKRLGNRSTQGVIGAGLLAALVLAMVDADTFWIGNAVWVAGVIGGLVETTVKIRAHRRDF